ncbi:MAG: hypothetical protein PHO62_07810 [Sulfurimonas sp.]|uniref:restriction endonuclease n=1 Tax=Sulfurimonas sp. TaxID=2022749 RepID=UPI002613E62F|nr:hypothetical protein [Sulfurimonas sp.]MDD5373312.1 hypothetical protein [Sulfurimonas sp.]
MTHYLFGGSIISSLFGLNMLQHGGLALASGGGLLFVAFAVEAKAFLKRREAAKMSAWNVRLRDNYSSARGGYCYVPPQRVYDEHKALDFKANSEINGSGFAMHQNHIGCQVKPSVVRESFSLSRVDLSCQSDFDMRCTVKGDVYESQIKELLKKAVRVFGDANHYGLDVSSLEIEPRGLRTQYDGGIDIFFTVRDRRGDKKIGAIQCKNWDSDRQIESSEIWRFFNALTSSNRKFVHAFFVCNIFGTVSDIDRALFKNINFLTIPSLNREKRNRQKSADDLIEQLECFKKGDFGAEFARALVHARLYEVKNLG